MHNILHEPLLFSINNNIYLNLLKRIMFFESLYKIYDVR